MNLDKNVDVEKKRKAILDRYMSSLENIEGIKLSKEKEGVKPNYPYFPVVFDRYKKRIKYLKN